jgi:hypothetical protein
MDVILAGVARNVGNSTTEGKPKIAATPVIAGMPVIAGTPVRAWTQATANSRDAEFWQFRMLYRTRKKKTYGIPCRRNYVETLACVAQRLELHRAFITHR